MTKEERSRNAHEQVTDDEAVHLAAVALGRRGGAATKGISTKRKAAASRRNIARARAIGRTTLLSKRKCSVCKTKNLYVTNKSGVCRECQRHGRAPHQ